MIKLWDIRYVRLGTPDLESATRYAREVIGLELGAQESGVRYFRSDDRDHTLVYFEGDPADHTVGFELRDREALESAAAQLENANIAVRAGTTVECEQRRVKAFVNFRDPTGNNIDLVVQPFHSGKRHFPSRDAGITGFSHIGLCSSDPPRDEKFWTGLMGAKVSDRIGISALLRIDEVHHKIALFPAKKPGVQHVNHQVESIDDVMKAYYRMKEAGIRIVFGPGRHPTSGACFLYFEGPDGMVYEYSTGVRLITQEQEASYQPRQFPMASTSFCLWGSKPDIAEFQV
ncbi:MAG: VOC family protein [Candidatus Competibacteraceae bacterium]|nr:VOC family protein [Candidatus Competibacteraceae bacterium]MCB1810619.1 VOC family protein [Candidatus Competibacteraceae bacterium]